MARSAAPIVVAALLLLAMAFTGTQALGINCRGSGNCGLSMDLNDIVEIRDAINGGIDGGRQYTPGEQIACTQSSICAFTQLTSNNVAGSALGALMTDLVNHGCQACGSVPLDFPNSNDVTQGELTVNFVSNPCVHQTNSALCV